MNPEQSDFWRPKFFQTAFAQLSGTIALFTGNIDQGGWITLTTMIIAMFTTASVIENKILNPPKSVS